MLWDDRWYNVISARREGRAFYYVNIATPVEFDGAQFHYIDLDLDVWWFAGEAPRLLDEDEFLAHSEAMRYPADVIERARAAVDDVLGSIGERAFPLIEDDARRPSGDGTERGAGRDERRRAPARGPAEIIIERPARPEHGDYATSLPLRLARAARANPLVIAKTIAAHLPPSDAIASAEVAPPGSSTSACPIHGSRRRSTRSLPPAMRSETSASATTRRVQVEFVSANPTGPLTAGNGRGAAIGDVLASVLQAAGYEVEREYLVNDAGTQTEVFGRTLLARYQQLFGRDARIPADGYPGDYMIELAQRLKDEFGDRTTSRRAATRHRPSS